MNRAIKKLINNIIYKRICFYINQRQIPFVPCFYYLYHSYLNKEIIAGRFNSRAKLSGYWLAKFLSTP